MTLLFKFDFNDVYFTERNLSVLDENFDSLLTIIKRKILTFS